MEYEDDLLFLDPDPDRAAAVYIEVHKALTKILDWNKCPDPTSLADEVIRRGMRRLREGVHIDVTPLKYFMGFVRYVVLEQHKLLRNRTVSLDAQPIADTNRLSEIDDRIQLQKILSSLSAEEQRLLREYYSGNRAKLAGRLGMTCEALRVRVFRLKKTILKTLAQRHPVSETKSSAKSTWKIEAN